MKRPLACFGFTLFAVLLCLNLFESTAVSVSLLILGAVAFIVSLIIKQTRQALIMPVVFCGIITGCLLFSTIQTEYNDTVALVGDNVSVSGVITERPEFSRENRRYYCVIKADSVSENKVRTKLRFSFSESYDQINPSDLQIGDRVSFIGTVYKTGTYSDFSRYSYKSKGIYLGAYSLEKFESENPSRRPIGYYINSLRKHVSDILMHDFDNKNGSLLVALLTGDKGYMPDEIYDSFIEAGIVHIMAVSGLHLSVWVAFLAMFMDFRGKKGKFLAVIMIFFTVFMMNFACFTGSVKRASAMTILYFIGKIFGKKTDPLNSLGFACICGLVFNPFAVFDISFLLSFLSTLGIIVMGIPLSDRIINKTKKIREDARRFLKPLITTASLSISVTIFTFPVSVLFLGGVSFAATATNLMIIFAVAPLLLMTGFYFFLRPIPFVSCIMAVLMKLLSSYILKAAALSSEMPFSYVYTGFERLGMWFFIAFAFLLIAMFLYKYSRILMKAAVIISAGVFLLSFSVNYYTSLDKCIITLYREENGSCVLVSLNGRGVLIGFDGDNYDKNEIADDVFRNKVKVDVAFFADEFISPDKQSICSLLDVGRILVCDGESAVLFNEITITKDNRNITVDTGQIKTEIFSKEYLQDDDKYDTITFNDGSFVFTFGENNPYTVTVITSGGERDG